MEAASRPLELLPRTRREIIVRLKREGPLSAGDLSERLEVSASAARQLLSALEGDGLVTHRRERRGPGRPVHLYELTERGDALFPRRYADLATELLGYLAEIDDGLLAEIFRRRRERRVAEARLRLDGLGFEGRVRELARILDEDGYLTEVRSTGSGFLIVEHNCAVHRVAERYGQACSSEIEFIREVLPGAQVRRVTHIASGGPACTYEIEPPESSI